jgi:hypothetical protein
MWHTENKILVTAYMLCSLNWLKPTSRAKGSFLMRRSVLLWYRRISLKATVPGRNLCGPAKNIQVAVQFCETTAC